MMAFSLKEALYKEVLLKAKMIIVLLCLFAVAGAVASAPVTVRNCANVATSFPLFVETAKQLQLQIEETVDNVQ